MRSLLAIAAVMGTAMALSGCEGADDPYSRYLAIARGAKPETRTTKPPRNAAPASSPSRSTDPYERYLQAARGKGDPNAGYESYAASVQSPRPAGAGGSSGFNPALYVGYSTWSTPIATLRDDRPAGTFTFQSGPNQPGTGFSTTVNQMHKGASFGTRTTVSKDHR